jgi:hypothetical protein
MTVQPTLRPEHLFAWCGWALRLPEDWRPLKFYGNGFDGNVHLGNAERGILRVRWQRFKGRGPDPVRWKKYRARSLGAGRGKPDIPAPADVPGVPDAVTVHTARGVVWSGCSFPTRLALEIAISADIDEPEVAAILTRILPTLQTYPVSEKTPWVLFNTSFRTPPGYLLHKYRLHLGDLAILVTDHARNARIMVRQVYPATLALQRRELKKWLAVPPFPDRRRRRRIQGPDRWEIRDGARSLDGFLESGTAKVPAPLGFWRPRFWTAAIVRDTTADRLLMAEAQFQHGDPVEAVRASILDMNRDAP